MITSVDVLTVLNQRDNFMNSIKIVADMGCGNGQDSAWWADTVDDDGKSRELFVFAIDKQIQIDNHNRRSNVRVVKEDFSHTTIAKNKVDVLWCANAFQYATDPVKTLRHWWELMSPGGALYISVPHSNFINEHKHWQVITKSGCFWPHNISSLIYLLAANGFDCSDGHFSVRQHDPFIHLFVYKDTNSPSNLNESSLYELDERKLLPPSISKCVQAFGEIRQEFLIFEWIDGSIIDLSIESIP